MKDNVRVPYYLYINGNIIDLEQLGLEDFTKYINLLAFTGYFKDFVDLEETLKKLGYIISDENFDDIKIVKRVGNKKDGYKYVTISKNIVFRDTLMLMGKDSISNFFEINKYNYEIMYYFFSSYRKKEIQRLNNARNKNNEYISGKIGAEIAIIDELCDITERLIASKKEFGSVNPILIPNNYDYLYEEFINLSLHYESYSGKTTNIYGLITLASEIKSLCKLDGVKKPLKTNNYNKLLSQVDDAINTSILEPNYEKTKAQVVDDDIDPDHYMFLESDDFNDLYPKTDAYNEVLNEQLDNLEEKKKRH